eukprot:1137556-Pelagomonas_calceolata.AAC.8
MEHYMGIFEMNAYEPHAACWLQLLMLVHNGSPASGCKACSASQALVTLLLQLSCPWHLFSPAEGTFGGAMRHGQTADQETRVRAHKLAQALKATWVPNRRYGGVYGGPRGLSSRVVLEGALTNPGNYRMISVSGVMYRIYANVLKDLVTD